MEESRILAINPGSTSTKIAVYQEKSKTFIVGSGSFAYLCFIKTKHAIHKIV